MLFSHSRPLTLCALNPLPPLAFPSLLQLIALRYGAIPVVRSTGGLADTVFDVDSPQPDRPANGFSFPGADEGSLNSALDRALDM